MSQIYRFGPFRLDARRGELVRGNTPVAVGGRALRVLGALVGRPGELVTKDELMAAGWPGIIVEEGNIPAQIRNLRQILGDDEAPHRFIVTVPGRGYRFVGDVTQPAAAPAPVRDARPSNLPLQASALIGRGAELTALRGMLASHKLVTLLGPGGIGKTRLALQAAVDALDDYADGVFLIELAGVTQAEQVPATAAAALNITVGGGDASEQLASALRGAAMLIILDNCEHLVEAASALAGALLRRNEGLTILATSRSPLGLPGEQHFMLPTLAVPDAAAVPGITTEAAAGYAGVQLFMARAALVQPSFVLDAGNAADIAAICRRLDGIALAIELAAARIRLLRPRDLLARLDNRFRLLTGGARTHLPRHQTLRALIDWSFELLTEAERVAFRRLGVFAGSFDLSGAEAVLPGAPIEALDVLDLVVSLLDKSLVTRLPAQDREPRYRLLDSTRHYALEKLDQAGETSALNSAHARHMVTVFGEARRRFPDTDIVALRADVEPEIENFQAALAWAFGENGDDTIAIALAARLGELNQEALVTTPVSTRRAYIRAAVKKLAPGTAGEDAAWLWLHLADDQSAGARAGLAAAETARALFEALQDRQGAGLAASLAAFYLARAGDAAAARRSADAARAVLRTSPPNLNRATTLCQLAFHQAIAARDVTEFANARRDYAAALEIYEKFNNRAAMLMVSDNLANIQAVLGDYAGAIERAVRNVAQSRNRRDWLRLASCHSNLTSYYLLTGDDAAAGQAAWEALPLVAELEDKYLGACFTGRVALLAARAGALETAAKFAGHTSHFYISNQETMETIEQRVWDALMALFTAAETAGKLTPASRAQWQEAGGTLSLQAALKLPLPFLGGAEVEPYNQ